MKHGLFSGNALVLLMACGIGLFALSVLLHAYDDAPVRQGAKSAPGSFSTSALGYAGIHDTLNRTGRVSLRSSGDPLSMTGRRGTLIVAEPLVHRLDSSDAARLMSAPRLLLVLPKWSGVPDGTRPAWIASARPVALQSAQETLALVDAKSEVFRKQEPEQWRNNELGVEPAWRSYPVSDPAAPAPVVQLIRSSSLRPVVGDETGMLVGEVLEANQKIWVLSDPDVMNNHGLVVGANAEFAIALLDELRLWNNDDFSTPLVFDETVHGFREAEGSPLKLLFRFPLAIVTYLTIASGIMLLLAGAGRFGVPAVTARAADFGKRGLISNGARLLDYSGHHSDIMRRYVRMVIRDVAQKLHAPGNLDDDRLCAWLDAVGKNRGVSLSCRHILTRSTTEPEPRAAAKGRAHQANESLARLFQSVRDIHAWKGEMLHEPARK